MSDLDKKLEEILFNMASNAAEWGQCHPEMDVNVERMTSREIAADYPDLIKQAFVDDGWQPKEVVKALQDEAQRHKENLMTLQRMELDQGLMTGQEWYDSFEKHTSGIDGYTDDEAFAIQRELFAAAKKAAGIE